MMSAQLKSANAEATNRGAVVQPWVWFVGALFCLNLVQIIFTELTSDEGYYWFYAHHLQWGYYDHPPLVAAIIKAGTFFSNSEAGVRIINLLLMTGANILFFRLIDPIYRNSWITFLLLLSVHLASYLSFIVFPDGALLFLSLIFLHVCRSFLYQPNLKGAMILGLISALMLYAKYHGVLMIVFVMMAYPRILKSGWLWLAGGFALILFLPHLFWQYQNDFPTFRYHLSGRSSGFSLALAVQFISQQVVALGPAIIFLPFVVRSRDVFERCLFVIIAGTLIFFLLSSFNTFVHFHWTSIAIYPLLYFAVAYYHRPDRRRLFHLLVTPFVILLLAFRLILMFDIGIQKMGEDVYHGRKQWAEEIDALARDEWVFFPNNLREAPLYQFYSHHHSATLYSRPEKKSQYKLWNYEDSLQGKEVLVINKYPLPGGQPFLSSIGNRYYYYQHTNFRSFYNHVSIEPITVVGGKDIEAMVIRNNRPYPLIFPEETKLVYSMESDHDVVKSGTVAQLSNLQPLQPGQSVKLKINFQPPPSHPGHHFYFGFAVPGLPESYNSQPISFDAKR